MTFRKNNSVLEEIFDSDLPVSETPLLSLKNVSVRIGGVAALSAVDLEVESHDVMAVIGPNGAGKTSALNAISGVYPSSGRITLGGSVISGLPAARIAKAGVGRSFQDPHLIDDYSALDNVLCGAFNNLHYSILDQLVRRKRVERLELEMTTRATALLEFLGLGEEALTPVSQLPFGSRKLIDIARAIVSGPRMLLLDEPSSGLDSREREKLRNILIQLREEKRVAMLLVEHHMDLVRTVATNVAVLQAGQVKMRGLPAAVLDSDEYRSLIVGDNGSKLDPAVQPPSDVAGR